MRVLIVSAIFDDQRAIGSQRPRAFARELALLGHEVTVITRGRTTAVQESVDEFGSRIIRIGPSILGHGLVRGFEEGVPAFRKRLKNARDAMTAGDRMRAPEAVGVNEQGASGRREPGWTAVATLLFRAVRDLDWTVRANIVARRLLGRPSYDILLSSYFPLGSLWLGNSLIVRRFARHWVCDFRDVMGSQAYPSSVNSVLHRIEKHSVNRAALVTVVSEGQRAVLMEVVEYRNSDKIVVLYNGYTKAASEATYQRSIDGRRLLKISYTGSLSAGRDAGALFRALSELADSGQIALEDIRFDYAGGSSKRLLSQASAWGMESVVVDHGQVDFSESRSIQRMSDLLLVLSWNSLREQGVLTGKFPEYLAARVPIVALISGELPGSELASLVSRLRVGVAYEEARSIEDFPLLKSFLAESSRRVQMGEGPEFDGREDLIREFDYSVLAKRLEALFQDLLSSTPRT